MSRSNVVHGAIEGSSTAFFGGWPAWRVVLYVALPAMMLPGPGTVRGWGQSACGQLNSIGGGGLDCSHSGSSSPGITDEDRRRWAEAREARREQRERDAEEARKRKQVRDAQKAREQAAKEEARLDAIAARERAEQAIRDQQAAQERARLQAIEAQRQQDAFNAMRPGAVAALKGSGTSGNRLGLRDAVASPAANAGAWADKIHDPQVAPMAHRLAKVVPPLPIPASEDNFNWKKIYINGDRLEKTSDLVVAGWEMAGMIEDLSVVSKVITVVGKGVIGDADGAWVFMTKRDEVYNAALAYSKDPAQARKFAYLVWRVKGGLTIPPGMDPAMLKAAQLVGDPHASSSAWGMWDAMTSREALSAALRKASVEAASDLISAGVGHQTNGYFKDMEARKTMYDSIRLERTAARKMLAEPGVTPEKAEELKAVIHKADDFASWIYRTDPAVKRVKEGFEGIGIGYFCDKSTEAMAGKATEGEQF
ncbi:MAG: hypothetical protein P4L03_03580 [Terracidiphilus sp.]|nr:hypothetical protein [Terracidiphilus sp.]